MDKFEESYRDNPVLILNPSKYQDFYAGNRLLYKIEDEKRVLTSSLSDAQLVSSRNTNNSHSIAIDIDWPCRLIPSSTPGHFHLYVDGLEINWFNYKELLIAMERCGLVQDGYMRASIEREATFLRLPWYRKF